MTARKTAFAAAALAAALAAGPATAQTGLVAHWSFDEGAGAVALDASGNGHHGAIVGATFTDGVIGRALDLDGLSSVVRVPNAPALQPPTALSIEAWVKLRSNAGPKVIVSKWDDNTQQWSYIFKKHNDQAGLRMELSRDFHTDLADVGGARALPLGRWVHVATTFDGSTVRLYVDGRLDAEGQVFVPAPIDASATDLLIGGVNPGGPTEVFDGVIDEVRLWDRALGRDEIAARVAALRPVFEAPLLDDAFDGTALDAARWDASIATDGVRWCSSTGVDHHRAPGVWQDPSKVACNGAAASAPWGTVEVADGVASFAGGFGQAFPYVFHGGPGLPSPFPAAGDFFLETRVQYDAIAPHGTGIMVLRWDDTTPAGNNPPLPRGQGLFSIWSDTGSDTSVRLGFLEAVTYGDTPSFQAGGFHDVRVECAAGTCAASVDGFPSIGATTDLRPNAIWIGNPVFTFWGPERWTAFSLDAMRAGALAVDVPVDVRPGGFPNPLPRLGAGLLPVAVLGSAALPAASIVPASLGILAPGGRVPVALRRNGTLQASLADVNGDGVLDLVAQFDLAAVSAAAGPAATFLVVDALTTDGLVVRGADSVVVR